MVARSVPIYLINRKGELSMSCVPLASSDLGRNDGELTSSFGRSFRIQRKRNLCSLHWMVTMRDMRGACPIPSETKVFRAGGRGCGSLGSAPCLSFLCVWSHHQRGSAAYDPDSIWMKERVPRSCCACFQEQSKTVIGSMETLSGKQDQRKRRRTER